MATRKQKRADYVEFGSEQHAALLGLSAVSNDPGEKAKAEAALKAGPPPVISKKRQVSKHTVRRGDEVVDGWVRQGR